MKRFNVTTKKVYESRGGQRQHWPVVGTLTHVPATTGKEESYYLELNMFPETRFYLFPQEPDEPGTKG